MCELVSKSPPNCGDVSSTTFAIPVLTEIISGLVPSLADAKTTLSPLFVAEKVKESPEPETYLN